MPHAAPIPALPNVVSFTLAPKKGAHGNIPARIPEFRHLFREHIAPQSEANNARQPVTGHAPEDLSLSAEDAIPERNLTADASSEAQSCLLTSISAGISQLKSPVQGHTAAGGNSIEKETVDADLQEGDIAPRPGASSRTVGTESGPSKVRDSKAKQDQAATPSAATTTPTSAYVQLIPQSAASPAGSPIAPDPVHPSASFPQDLVRSSKSQLPNVATAEPATEPKNDLPDQAQSVPGQALANASHSRVDQITSASVPGAKSGAPLAPEHGVTSKDEQQPPISARNSAVPHSDHAACETNSVEAISSANTGAVVTSHATQQESLLSPAQPIDQSPVKTFPGASADPTPNLYDRMDQGTPPAILHSGAQHVVVGIHDPNLGWLEIKTQSIAGHVDATLVTASGQAHASLAGQLPSIVEYLQQRELKIGTLSVHHHMQGTNGGGGPSNGSPNSGTGAQNSNHSRSGHREEAPAALSTRDLNPLKPTSITAAENHQTFRPVSYISVRA